MAVGRGAFSFALAASTAAACALKCSWEVLAVTERDRVALPEPVVAAEPLRSPTTALVP